MALRTLTVRGVGDATLSRLRSRAESNRRSLNSELLTILEHAAGEDSAAAPSPSAREAPPSAGREAPPPAGSEAPLPALPEAPPPVVREAPPAYASADLLRQVDVQQLADICRRYGIEWLAVFGSHVRGDARGDSDVDVVVEFAPGRTPGFGFVRVADALRAAFLGRPVDLFTRNGLSPRLRERIDSCARTLYGAQ
jgi:uncharacterized protein